MTEKRSCLYCAAQLFSRTSTKSEGLRAAARAEARAELLRLERACVGTGVLGFRVCCRDWFRGFRVWSRVGCRDWFRGVGGSGFGPGFVVGAG